MARPKAPGDRRGGRRARRWVSPRLMCPCTSAPGAGGPEGPGCRNAGESSERRKSTTIRRSALLARSRARPSASTPPWARSNASFGTTRFGDSGDCFCFAPSADGKPLAFIAPCVTSKPVAGSVGGSATVRDRGPITGAAGIGRGSTDGRWMRDRIAPTLRAFGAKRGRNVGATVGQARTARLKPDIRRLGGHVPERRPRRRIP
jgi:hypothetical protein